MPPTQRHGGPRVLRALAMPMHDTDHDGSAASAALAQAPAATTARVPAGAAHRNPVSEPSGAAPDGAAAQPRGSRPDTREAGGGRRPAGLTTRMRHWPLAAAAAAVVAGAVLVAVPLAHSDRTQTTSAEEPDQPVAIADPGTDDDTVPPPPQPGTEPPARSATKPPAKPAAHPKDHHPKDPHPKSHHPKAHQAGRASSHAAVPAAASQPRKSGTTVHAKPAALSAAAAPRSKPAAKPAAAHKWSTKVVQATTVLHAGDSVASNRMRITMLRSGALVISDENGVIRWSSRTTGSGNRAVFQDDGNLVVYASDGRSLWTSGTAGHSGARLVIQNDGNVTIQTSTGALLWAAGTDH
ncbi:hypothetical protein [Streptomyces sp. NPDC002520]